MLTPNGFLIQDLTASRSYIRTEILPHAPYRGVHLYHDDPLLADACQRDPACRALNHRRLFLPAEDGYSVYVNFIGDPAFLVEYLEACRVYDRPYRLLFICSDYEDEVWRAPLPPMTLLGYECCEIPFDDCCIYDLFTYDESFTAHRARLNENGLFPTEAACRSFRDEYARLLFEGKVGDGEADLFVCAVYEVATEDVPIPTPHKP